MIRKIKYTDEDLLEILNKIKDLIRINGKIPKDLEIYKLGIIGDLRPIKRYLKTLGYDDWVDYFRDMGFKKETDIKVGNKYKSRKSINIEDLKIIFNDFYLINKKYPTSQDFNASYNELPSFQKVTNILKENNLTWSEYLLSEFNIFIPDTTKYDEYIIIYKIISNKLGRPLKYGELLHNIYQLPTANWFVKYCPDKNVKDYNNFIEYVGYKPRYKMSKELAIKMILELQEKLNRPIMMEDLININEDCDIGISTIKKYWGTMNKMKEELGLEIVQESMIDRQKSKEEMINDMQNFINQLGRLPLVREVNENKNMLGSCAYFRYFGGINNVFLSLGYIPNKKDISQHLTNDEIVKIYQDFVDDLDVTPTYDFCKKIYELPSPRTVIRRLDCSWNDFMIMLGCIPNSDHARGSTCKAKDNTICLSIAECFIHNYFLDNNINIISKEYCYRNLVEDNEELKSFIGYKRFDWLLQYNNNFYIVEYFGLMGNYDYNNRHDKKIEFINRANLQNNFIALYPKDLNRLDNIFNFIN